MGSWHSVRDVLFGFKEIIQYWYRESGLIQNGLLVKFIHNEVLKFCTISPVSLLIAFQTHVIFISSPDIGGWLMEICVSFALCNDPCSVNRTKAEFASFSSITIGCLAE